MGPKDPAHPPGAVPLAAARLQRHDHRTEHGVSRGGDLGEEIGHVPALLGISDLTLCSLHSWVD